ncbi:ArsR family transcriptional regulator [Pyrococcus sp. ST04]|uniref:ArsR family transcriptional regulator n=1 Tax=Pyrococcus sp. ST04 TaxID=1183377 RepID=UPI0002605EDE|nr:ArsR family transcriptional regulator [Pyrococcus sp. ST04]AFK23234.1 transcriptional regulator, ArsR family [Pyrococcus sp. ST04]
MENDELVREVQRLRETLNEIMKTFAIISQMAQAYLRLLNVYAEYGGVGIDVVIPEIKNDPIAREIVRILFDLKKANISEITRELRGRRGKASRNTVRSKIKKLEQLGIVVEANGERGIRRWRWN